MSNAPTPARHHTYLFTLVDGGGTVAPELAAVRGLVARGHHVTVLAEDTMIDEVVATGATFRRWSLAPNRPTRRPEDDPYRDWECKNPVQLFQRLIDRQFVGPAEAYATDTAAAIADRRPDLVVCSMFALGAMVAAEAAGVAFDILFPNIYLLPAEGMPPMGLGLMPAAGRLGRARDRAIRGFADRAWSKGLAGLNEVRRARGLDDLSRLWDQAAVARRQLVLTSPDFDFPARLPDNARYVGPVLDDPAWTGGADAWSVPPGDDPLVLVAMSSTFQDQRDTIERVVDALATMPVRALVTTGPSLDPASFEPRANVSVVEAVPHNQVLPHASVVVTHGGHGTVVKALAAGVPLVVMHHGRDQADNAARVVARRAGVKVGRGAKPSAIRKAVGTLVDDPAYAEHARALGAAIRRDAASGALVRELEDLDDAPGAGSLVGLVADTGSDE